MLYLIETRKDKNINRLSNCKMYTAEVSSPFETIYSQGFTRKEATEAAKKRVVSEIKDSEYIWIERHF